MSTSMLTNSLTSITGVWRHASTCVNTLPQTPAHKYSHLQKPTEGQSSSVPALHLACSHLLCLPHSMEHLDQLWVNISLYTPSLSSSLPVSVPHFLSSSSPLLCPSLCSRDVPLISCFQPVHTVLSLLKEPRKTCGWGVHEICMGGAKREQETGTGRQTDKDEHLGRPNQCYADTQENSEQHQQSIHMWMERKEKGQWLTIPQKKILLLSIKKKKKHRLTKKRKIISSCWLRWKIAHCQHWNVTVRTLFLSITTANVCVCVQICLLQCAHL